MSLVILSNDAKEQSDIVSSVQSIYKPWSFRNSLSSTMEIPANSQIALTSAKISLDGQISLDAGDKILYVYLGKWLDPDQDLDASNSYPIKVKLFEDEPGVVITDTEGLAAELEKALNKFVCHPHYAKRCAVSVNRNNTTGEFEGYKIEMKQADTEQELIPSGVGAGRMIAESTDALLIAARNIPLNRSYTITTSARNDVILTPQFRRDNIQGTTFNMTTLTPPACLTKGKIEFDLQKCIGNVPAGAQLNVNFVCGLSRFTEEHQRINGRFVGPSYFAWNDSSETTANTNWLRMFGDFMLVNTNGELRLFDTSTNGDAARVGVAGANRRRTRWREIDYTQRGTSPAPFNVIYDTTTNARRLQTARFTLDGERVKIEMIDGAAVPTTYTLYEYSQTRPGGAPRLPDEIMKPIDQGCEAMMPVMGIHNFGIPQGNAPSDYSIALSKYEAVNITDIPNVQYTTELPVYEADPDRTIIPWFNLVAQTNPQGTFHSIIEELENRFSRREVLFGDTTAQDQFQKCWKPVIITSSSDQYYHSQGANTMRLLGFSGINGIATGDAIWSDDGETDDQFIYSLVSTEIPVALSSKSIFVRVDNFNQTSTNAANGNKSGIIAHLPRFDGQQQTGRLFFEPKNLIYLDLNNPAPMKINSFDISFVYSDETYCSSLVGSSIVVLHIREKGKSN